jgi:hypothetical protein
MALAHGITVLLSIFLAVHLASTSHLVYNSVYHLF